MSNTKTEWAGEIRPATNNQTVNSAAPHENTMQETPDESDGNSSENFDEPMPIQELRGFLEAGPDYCFMTEQQMVDDLVETSLQERDVPADRRELEKLVREEVDARLREEATWPLVTDCDRLNAAFKQLNDEGIVARQHFSCCPNCGHRHMEREVERFEKEGREAWGYVFYDIQSTDAAIEIGELTLNYGGLADDEESTVFIGELVVDALRDHGLNVEWDGDPKKTILVKLVWMRRLDAGKARFSQVC
jgi:hypothetical protein